MYHLPKSSEKKRLQIAALPSLLSWQQLSFLLSCLFRVPQTPGRADLHQVCRFRSQYPALFLSLRCEKNSEPQNTFLFCSPKLHTNHRKFRQILFQKPYSVLYVSFRRFPSRFLLSHPAVLLKGQDKSAGINPRSSACLKPEKLRLQQSLLNKAEGALA